MKRIVLILICAVAITSLANAQDRRSTFRVDAPANLMGEKIIEEIDQQGTSPWGTGIDSIWEGMDVKYDPTNLDGCGAGGFAANFFDGKFALIYRGGCEFGAKALAAQNAGARGVILVNNLLGVVGMGAGAQGANVTIPVVMITKAEGDAILSVLMAPDPVTVSLTGWRFDPAINPIDLGIKHNGPIYPQGRAMPAKQLVSTVNTDENFRLFGGGRWYNFSTQSIDTILSRSVLTTPSGKDSNIVTIFNPNTWMSTDSIIVTLLDSIGGAPAGFDMNDAAVGSYSMLNEIQANPSTYTETGLNANNNVWEYSFEVTDSVYSKCEYDVANSKPVVNSYIALTAGNYEWGPMLYIRNGGFKAEKMQCVIMRDIIEDSVFTSQNVLMRIYKWDDNDANNALSDITELTEVGNGQYLMTANDVVPIEGFPLTLDIANVAVPGAPVYLEPNSYYWVTVEFNGNQTNSYGIGLDYYSNYTGSTLDDEDLFSIQGSPLYDIAGNQYFGGGFANEGAPAVALIMSNTADPLSAQDVKQFAGNVTLYPNPASDQINIDLSQTAVSKNIQYEILDVTGKTISSVKRTNIQNEVYTMTTAQLSAGTYFMKVTTDKGAKTNIFTITK